MLESSFHSLRLRSVAHGKQLASFAKELGNDSLTIEDKVLKHASPSLVAVIGNKDSGKSQLIANLLEIYTDEVFNLGASEEYGFLCHEESPPHREHLPERSSYITAQRPLLKKHTFVEIRKADQAGVLLSDTTLARAEGVIIIVDARDPWSGIIWKYLELCCESHRGRIIFCVSFVQELHVKDWPVLKKHLEDKLLKMMKSKVILKRLDYGDLFTFHDIRSFLENYAVGTTKWNELRALIQEFQLAFGSIESTMKQQRAWLEGAIIVSDTLKTELITLRKEICSELLQKVESMGVGLNSRAEEILLMVRAKLTFKAYLASLIGHPPSMIAFQQGLEAILSKALFSEVCDHYAKTNQLIAIHARKFAEENPSLARYCPLLTGDQVYLKAPFLLDRESVDKEIQKVLRQLRLKPLFRQELEQIDEISNVRLRLAMLLFIVAGAVGGMLYHELAFCLIFSGASVIVWAIISRKRSLNQFVEFLNEWFLGIGSRMLEPMEYLSNDLVDYAIDKYASCFRPYLDKVNERQISMPEILIKGRELYFENNVLIKKLKE